MCRSVVQSTIVARYDSIVVPSFRPYDSGHLQGPAGQLPHISPERSGALIDECRKSGDLSADFWTRADQRVGKPSGHTGGNDPPLVQPDGSVTIGGRGSDGCQLYHRESHHVA